MATHRPVRKVFRLTLLTRFGRQTLSQVLPFMIRLLKGRIAMPISIKNDQTELLARKLAELTGETLTEAVRVAVAERYDRLRRARSGRSLASELNAIALRCAKRPIVSPLSADEILGYDESGVPAR
ncbi:MAG: type II toxin-antitoxin system VapB family antitoxin [Bryobacteraceae bacterium]